MNRFDEHWKKIADASIPENKLEQAKLFLEPLMSVTNCENNGYTKVLDAGCGDGVHLEVLSNSDLNIQCRAIDIAEYAVRSVNSRYKENFCKAYTADIQHLPFDDESFEIVYSYGVIGYSDDPREAIHELSRVLKKGGMIGIWVYPCESMLKKTLFTLARNFSQRLGPFITEWICHLLVPFMVFMPISSKINLGNSSWKACHEILMVNLNPEQLQIISKKELLSWMEMNGLSILNEFNHFDGAIYAKKNCHLI